MLTLAEIELFLFQARGPQCALYVPGPILRPGDNVIVCTLSVLMVIHFSVMIFFSAFAVHFLKIVENSTIHLSMLRKR